MARAGDVADGRHRSANRFALDSIMSRKPVIEASASRGPESEVRLRPLSGAQRQPQFLLDLVVHLVEIQRCLTLVAQHFQYLRPLFL